MTNSARSDSPSVLPVDAVLTGHRAFGLEIRQERNVQFAVFAEGEMAPDAVDGDADDLRLQTRRIRASTRCRAPTGRCRRGSSRPDRRPGLRAVREIRRGILFDRGWLPGKSQGLELRVEELSSDPPHCDAGPIRFPRTLPLQSLFLFYLSSMILFDCKSSSLSRRTRNK